MFADRTRWNLKVNRLSEALAQHRAAGKPLLDLTVSNPTECGFEYDRGAILQALANPASLAYNPEPRGLPIARQAVAAYYAARAVEVPADSIILTTSTSEAYSFVFRALCNPGDEILIPEPSYPLFAFLADIQDVKLVRYPLDYDYGWQINFHLLQQGISERTRGVIVVHPNNPTGHFTKPRELEKLNEICSSRKLAIIADEVFLDFTLQAGRPPFTFARNAAALTFTMSGLSKISGLPQMKAAWLVASGLEPLRSQAFARLEIIADTYLSMNAPVQHALPVLVAAAIAPRLDRIQDRHVAIAGECVIHVDHDHRRARAVSAARTIARRLPHLAIFFGDKFVPNACHSSILFWCGAVSAGRWCGRVRVPR